MKDAAGGEPRYRTDPFVRAARTVSRAIDGNAETRWSSEFQVDPQWLVVDLGSVWRVSEVKVMWETAYATAYRLGASTDGSNWKTVYSTGSGSGGTVRASFSETPARYIRLYATARVSDRYGYSLWELEVR